MAKSGAPSRLAGTTTLDRSADTRRVLVEAAIETLKDVGYAGASARAIAERAGSNQGLVFYHFGSVANLLLAALDAVSADRLDPVPGRRRRGGISRANWSTWPPPSSARTSTPATSPSWSR